MEYHPGFPVGCWWSIVRFVSGRAWNIVHVPRRRKRGVSSRTVPASGVSYMFSSGRRVEYRPGSTPPTGGVSYRFHADRWHIVPETADSTRRPCRYAHRHAAWHIVPFPFGATAHHEGAAARRRLDVSAWRRGIGIIPTFPSTPGVDYRTESHEQTSGVSYMFHPIRLVEYRPQTRITAASRRNSGLSYKPVVDYHTDSPRKPRRPVEYRPQHSGLSSRFPWHIIRTRVEYHPGFSGLSCRLKSRKR